MTQKKPVLVKYVGPSQHTRIISVQDQIDLGSDQESAEAVGTITWDAAHGHIANVAGIDAAVKLYFENNPEQFSFDVTQPGVAHLDATGAPLVNDPDAELAELSQDNPGDIGVATGPTETTGTPNARSTSDSPS